MYCKNCGANLDNQAVVCPYCGVATDNLYAVPVEEAKKEGNGMALAGFICSFFVPLLGWIFGGIGLSRAKKREGKGKGFSIAALVIASVMFFVYLGQYV
ncbi:MAG: zinc-ribbon domain-containing protein [Clostridia bacterium]|nr:zinc-ribbon domain-containing protein [Clostridia bacterium]